MGHFFAPLEALYSTKFGSKHHIMVQLANVYNAGINDPFLDLWGPLWKLSKGHFLSKQAILRLKIVLNLAFLAPEMVIRLPKLTKLGPGYSMWVVTTGGTNFIPYICIFWGQKCKNLPNTPKL